MGGIGTHQQIWNHCTVRSTNRSINMYPGFTTKDKQNRYTTSSIGSSKLEKQIVDRIEGS
jgi:hypothetical protein